MPSSTSTLLQRIDAEFGSMSQFRDYFSSAAMGVMGSGYLWLTFAENASLGVVPTYAPGTLLVVGRRQVSQYVGTLGEIKISEESEQQPEEETQSDKTGEQTEHSSWSSNSSSSTSNSTSGHSMLGDIPKSDIPSSSRSFSTTSHAQKPKALKRTPHLPASSIQRPLLCLSLYEHAWLSDFGINGKEEYIRKFWSVIDWDKVEKNFEEAGAKRSFDSSTMVSSLQLPQT